MWAGCFVFLGSRKPSLMVPTAEIAASGRAVGYCGVVGLHTWGGGLGVPEGMDNFYFLLPFPGFYGSQDAGKIS